MSDAPTLALLAALGPALAAIVVVALGGGEDSLRRATATLAATGSALAAVALLANGELPVDVLTWVWSTSHGIELSWTASATRVAWAAGLGVGAALWHSASRAHVGARTRALVAQSAATVVCFSTDATSLVCADAVLIGAWLLAPTARRAWASWAALAPALLAISSLSVAVAAYNATKGTWSLHLYDMSAAALPGTLQFAGAGLGLLAIAAHFLGLLASPREPLDPVAAIFAPVVGLGLATGPLADFFPVGFGEVATLALLAAAGLGIAAVWVAGRRDDEGRRLRALVVAEWCFLAAGSFVWSSTTVAGLALAVPALATLVAALGDVTQTRWSAASEARRRRVTVLALLLAGVPFTAGFVVALDLVLGTAAQAPTVLVHAGLCGLALAGLRTLATIAWLRVARDAWPGHPGPLGGGSFVVLVSALVVGLGVLPGAWHEAVEADAERRIRARTQARCDALVLRDRARARAREALPPACEIPGADIARFYGFGSRSESADVEGAP